jgi:phospholipid-translocating ATPase
LVYYLKGAELVMRDKIRISQRVTVDEQCENLALEGLRTLVITQKVITQEEYDEWKIKY